MRKGIIGSAALHVGLIGMTMVTWPSSFSQSEEPLPIVPVELITIAEVTNIQATVREEPPPPEPELPELEPVPEVAIVEPEPPEPEPLPELEPEPEPEPEEVAEVEPEPEPAPPEPPLEKPEPEQEEFNLDSVIALLDSRAPAQPAQPAEQTRPGIGDRNLMTMNLRDSIQAQMYQCWSPPIGAPNPEELIVEVSVFLARNGAIARAPQLSAASRAAAAGNPFMRAAAEAALRAVNICAPYRNLPPDQYAQWNEIVITFDPTRMAGR